MKIPIGCKLYSMRLVEGKLGLDGKVSSICDHQQREILISDAVPENFRMQVVAAAVAEAWTHEIGMLRGVPFVGKVS